MDFNLWIVFLSEMLGTMTLVALGTSVNAGVNMRNSHAYTKSKNNWIVVSVGWGAAVMIGAAIAQPTGSINAAFSLAELTVGDWNWATFAVAVSAEFIGALLGALITVMLFWNHFQIHYASQSEDVKVKLVKNGENLEELTNQPVDKNYDTLRGIFVTTPGVSLEENKKDPMVWISSFAAEFLGVFFLISAILIPLHLGILNSTFVPIYAGLLVAGLVATIGGVTGPALNPTRDLCPRIIYTLIPFKDKKTAQWSYSWVPVVAPLAAGAVSAGITLLITNNI